MTDIMTNIDLVRKIAWIFTKRSCVFEFDDIFSEACVAYLEGEQQFDPTKGVAKTTFLWTYIQNHLLNRVLDAQSKYVDREATADVYELQIPTYAQDPLTRLIATTKWGDFYASLTPAAQEVCDILLDASTGYLPIDAPKLCRGRIRDELRARGWSWSTRWTSYRELKTALATASPSA